MRKVLGILMVTLFSVVSTNAMAGSYRLNESNIEAQFADAQDVTFEAMNVALTLKDNYDYVRGEGNDTELVGGIVALAGLLVFAPVVTIFPLHRFIIGTGGQAAKIWALYCVTLGGCGVITLVDGILLLIDHFEEGGSAYLDNSKFIMWMD